MVLTVPCVPTGINTGVSTGPCAVHSRPSRARDDASSCKTSNVPVSGISRTLYPAPARLVENSPRPAPPHPTFFHAMEKLLGIFPRYGKKFSTLWKNAARASPFRQKFSTVWKKVFHTVEESRPRNGAARESRFGCRRWKCGLSLRWRWVGRWAGSDNRPATTAPPAWWRTLWC